MRIRTVKPEFWSHPVMGRASDGAKLLAIGLLNIADDKGFFYHDAILIRNAVRPFDGDSHTTHALLTELSLQGYFELRKHPSHGEIGWISGFVEHQVINRPSKHSMRDLWDSSIPHTTLTESSLSTHPGKERKGTGKGMEGNICAPNVADTPEAVPAITPKPPGSSRMLRPTPEEVNAYGATLTPKFTEGEKFCDFYESKGWLVGKNPMKSWEAAVRTWQKNTSLSCHGTQPAPKRFPAQLPSDPDLMP